MSRLNSRWDFLSHVVAKAVGMFRRSDNIVLAVDPPIAFGDVVVGTHLHPGDKHRVHEALQLAARRQAA